MRHRTPPTRQGRPRWRRAQSGPVSLSDSVSLDKRHGRGDTLRCAVALFCALLAACAQDDGEANTSLVTSPLCTEAAIQDTRRALLEATALPLQRPAMPALDRGPIVNGHSFSVQALRWQHGEFGTDQVHALLFLPSPLPDGGLPLLLNAHGHWGAGLAAREVAGRSQMFAREGWAVLSVASRGAEHGAQDVPDWRRAHFSDGLYGEMRARRGGKTPLGWDVVALWGGLDAALAGRLGVAIRSDAVAVMGFSGGAERAITLAASDPRVGASVVGATEYAFATQNGQALCSCGALLGGRSQGPAWLAQIACRPGNPPRERPALLWQDPASADSRVQDLLQDFTQVVVRPTEQHGVSDSQAAESLLFLEEALLGRDAPPERPATLVSELREHYLQLDERLHQPLLGAGAPGHAEQGLPPWRGAGPVRIAAARATLGLPPSGTASARPPGLAPPQMKLRHARSLQSGYAWVVVVASKPGETPAAEWASTPPGSAALGADDFITGDAPAIFVRPAVAASATSDRRASRWSIDGPGTALGLAVEDVLEAHARLRQVRGVVPQKIGFVGIGAGAVPALWAAALLGVGGPIALIDAPITLWWDGPEPAEGTQPWPSWLLPPRASGAALDPWLAARSLSERVRWLRPKNGSGAPWTGQRLPGATVKTAEQLFVRAARP